MREGLAGLRLLCDLSEGLVATKSIMYNHSDWPSTRRIRQNPMDRPIARVKYFHSDRLDRSLQP